MFGPEISYTKRVLRFDTKHRDDIGGPKLILYIVMTEDSYWK